MNPLARPAALRRWARFGPVPTLAGLAFAALAALSAAAAPEPAPPPGDGQAPLARPVLLELFTSQGCSSCPPADRLLARLGEQARGAIVPLAFHVDSWNRLGWRDPFSRREWTLRHEAYTRALDEPAYTPQAVVGGRASANGSDEAAIRAAVAAAAARPAADLSLTFRPTAARLDVSVAVELPPALRETKLQLLAALFETGLSTPVERGENGGRTLDNDYVVRQLERVARLPAGGPARSEHGASFELDAAWARARLGIAAFLQDPGSMEVFGAAAVTLADAGAGSG